MQSTPAAPSKARSQTAKQRARGCFKKRGKCAFKAQQLRYFQQDHLGSIAVITDEVSSLWQGASDSVTSISRQPYVSTAVAIGVAYYTGSVNGLGWSATAAGAAGAAAGAMTAGGNATQIVKAAAIGGLTAWGFEWAGTTGGATSYTRYAAHAAVGCASSVASGGQCRQGAAAAVFGKWVTNYTPQDWGVAARGVAATAAGGVGSVIGGGKFENGAVTAAYGYLFNHLAHVGGSARVPILGGISASVGVSYNNGEWDVGIIIDNDVPGVGVNKMLAKGTLDVGYQTGDFKTNAGESSVSYQAGGGGYGVNVQTEGGQGGFSGASLSVGPQLGVSVGGQVTRTMSVRTHVLPLIDRAKQWMGWK